MEKNTSVRIGLSIQGVGMAWCKCYKENDIYIIERFEEHPTSYELLKQKLGYTDTLYIDDCAAHDLCFTKVGRERTKIKTLRDTVEPLIASVINDGNLEVEDEKCLKLIERVIKNDYLIRDRETPAAQALHYGLGELIVESSKPLGYMMAPMPDYLYRLTPQYRIQKGIQDFIKDHCQSNVNFD